MVNQGPKFRTYVRFILTEKGIDLTSDFGKGVIEVADSYFWSVVHPNNGLDSYMGKSIPRLKRMGLSEDDIERVKTIGEELSTTYNNLSEDERDPSIKRKVQSEKERKTARIKNKFETLMGYTDQEIHIMNTNPRIDFDINFPFYSSTDNEMRRKIKNRTLTREEYDTFKTEMKSSGQYISLNIEDYSQRDLQEYATEILPLDEPFVNRMRARNIEWGVVEDVISRILNGETMQKQQIRSYGLDPKEIESKVSNLLRRFRVRRAEIERLMRPPTQRELNLDIPRGSDPRSFEVGSAIMTKNPTSYHLEDS